MNVLIIIGAAAIVGFWGFWARSLMTSWEMIFFTLATAGIGALISWHWFTVESEDPQEHQSPPLVDGSIVHRTEEER